MLENMTYQLENLSDQNDNVSKTCSSAISSALSAETKIRQDPERLSNFRAINSGIINSEVELVFAMPTAPRIYGKDYLGETLDSYRQLLPNDVNDRMFGKISVVIFNSVHDNLFTHIPAPPLVIEHPPVCNNCSLCPNVSCEITTYEYIPRKDCGDGRILFMNATCFDYGDDLDTFTRHKSRFENSTSAVDRIHFHFVENPGNLVPQAPADEPWSLGGANVPGSAVRQQTRDMSSMGRYLEKTFSPTAHVVLVEDDFSICQNAINAIIYAIGKCDQRFKGVTSPTFSGTETETDNPGWIGIRMSYGLNGVVLQLRDLSVLATYWNTHLYRRPPDHLTVEWLARETEESRSWVGQRVLAAYKYNVWNHRGKISSLRQSFQGEWPGCWQELLEPTVFEVEAFKHHLCPSDDIWPCSAVRGQQYRAIFEH